MPMNLVKSYAYTFEYVYRTPPGTNYNKSLTGLIALGHVSTFGAVAHKGGWRDAALAFQTIAYNPRQNI